MEHWPRSAVRAYRDSDPAVTAAGVIDAPGVAMSTAFNGLQLVRGRRIADRLEASPCLEPQQAAEQLGYPAIARRRALAAAESEQCRRQVRPYLQGSNR
ncbi:hypothetical protein [Streptomyces sp. A5-4]|uniref:hypothetical protein n=1 Tax=Streptomyces sp. A5-4 TaxID=3384771 RepID=UPI003DA8D4E3